MPKKIKFEDLLPKASGDMHIGQAVFLEVLDLLVTEGVITETAAAKKYAAVRTKNTSWRP